MPVAGIAGITDQRLVIDVKHQAEREQQRRARPGGHHDPVDRDREPVAIGVVAADRLAELGEAQGRRVEHRLRAERLRRGLDDRLGRGEIRLTDLEVDDIRARGLHPVSLGEHLHDLKRGDAPDTAGETVECAHGRARAYPLAERGSGDLPGPTLTTRDQMRPVNVSQLSGLPVVYPLANHFWRCADEPCVQVSGVTRPWNSS